MTSPASAATFSLATSKPTEVKISPYSALPIEIKQLIASHLSNPDLKALSRVSEIHIPIALKALNELEKTTALRQLRELSNLNPEKLPVSQSLLGVYNAIVCELREENLLNMDQPQELELKTYLETLSTHHVASGFLTLNQTISKQINANTTCFDNIEIDYLNAKKTYVIDALTHIIAAAIIPESAREIAAKIAVQAFQFDIAQALLESGPISQDGRGILAIACSVKTTDANFFQNVIRISEISREDRGWALRMATMRTGGFPVVHALLKRGPITRYDMQSSLTNAKNYGQAASATILQYYLDNNRFVT
jgi:hypothetical protein